MNTVQIIGNLTTEPQIRNQMGTVVCFGIAVDRPYNERQYRSVDFFQVVCFGDKAVFASSYLRKGIRVAIYGSLQNHEYYKDGKSIMGTQIKAEGIEIMDRKDVNMKYFEPQGYGRDLTNPDQYFDAEADFEPMFLK